MTEPGRCDVDGLLGRRVVVRYRVGAQQTDAVGVLSADGRELVVQTRRGPGAGGAGGRDDRAGDPACAAAAGVADGDRAGTGWTEHHRYRYLVPPA